MVRLVALGVVASLFFSSTFILNRAMSLEGGHWLWSASLRYVYMLLFIGALLAVRKGLPYVGQVWQLFRQYAGFWILAGSIGFGVFYALLAFSATYAAGWVVATTWEITVLATPLVLLVFGKRVPTKGIVLGLGIFLGIVLVNAQQATHTAWQTLLWGTIPVVVSAFAYPLGLQLVWEATRGENTRIPHIQHPIMQDSFARVLLLTLGSMPFWLVLTLFIAPPSPTTGQWVNTALVALFSGVIATTLFLYARHECHKPHEIAAVDASQSMEVIFSLLGEIALLHGVIPTPMAWLGVGLTVICLIAYARLQA